MTLRRHSGSAHASAVLRGVLLHGQPHTLARGERTAVEGESRIPANSHQAASDPSEGARRNANAAFEAGLAQGRQEGFESAAARSAEEAKTRDAVLGELRALAAAEGRLEGLAQGRDEALITAGQAQAQAMERADQAAAERMQRLDLLLHHLRAERVKHLEEAEEDLVALAHQVICRILGAHAHKPESIRRMVRHLLERDGARAHLAVHLHPDDLAALEQEREAHESAWQWVADATVQLGGVVLRSPDGSLDARLETQLAALRNELLKARSDRRNGNPHAASEEQRNAGSAS